MVWNSNHFDFSQREPLAFYLLSTNFPKYLEIFMDGNYSSSLILTAVILIIITIPLPLFGRLADRYDNRKMLIFSAGGILALLYPICFAIQQDSLFFTSLFIFFFAMFFTCLSALTPYIMCDLFPTRVRFTCVGLSFNLVDATIGGFTPVLALLLLRLTNIQISFCLILLVCSLLSLFSYIYLFRPKHAR